jgi:hypothetical protein
MANQKPMSPAEWEASSKRIQRVYPRTKQEQYEVALAEYERKSAMTVEEKREERTQEAIIKANFMGLAKLKGSEKQIAWAESLRASLLATLDESESAVLLSASDANKAKFWIDNRDQSIGYILEAAKINKKKPTKSDVAKEAKVRAEESKARVAKALKGAR